jgi:hypothetical protein
MSHGANPEVENPPHVGGDFRPSALEKPVKVEIFTIDQMAISRVLEAELRGFNGTWLSANGQPRRS